MKAQVLLSIVKLLVYMDTVNSQILSFSLLCSCTLTSVLLGEFALSCQSFSAPCSTYSQGISISLPETTLGADLATMAIVLPCMCVISPTFSMGVKAWPSASGMWVKVFME